MFGSSDLTDDLTDRSVIWSVSCALDSLPVLGGVSSRLATSGRLILGQVDQT
jgi:hypothetical protein